MRFRYLVSSIIIATCMVNSLSAAVFEEVGSGHGISPEHRAAIAENGDVAFIRDGGAAGSRIEFKSFGGGTSEIDFASHGLSLGQTAHVSLGKTLQIHDAGHVVFIAERTASGGSCLKRGVYSTDKTGSFLTTLHEACLNAAKEDEQPPNVEVALSSNGTVAFSTIRDGGGAIYRGQASGPVAVLREGTGFFYNTGSLDVNDAGRVAVQIEYTDGYVGSSMRGVLLFNSLNQERDNLDVAIEKMGIGDSPKVSINNLGQVALSFDKPATVSYINSDGSFATDDVKAGVYIATPNPFNSALNNPPMNLVKIADTSGGYCNFGNVDINDSGRVVFEARLDGNRKCGDFHSKSYDGIFTGSDPVYQRVVTLGDSELGVHQYFDSVRLGELNNSGQITLISTYSEPLVDGVKVWRVDLAGVDRLREDEKLPLTPAVEWPPILEELPSAGGIECVASSSPPSWCYGSLPSLNEDMQPVIDGW
jgi:hypothetical protein